MDRFVGLEVDHKLQLGGLQDRQIGGLCNFYKLASMSEGFSRVTSSASASSVGGTVRPSPFACVGQIGARFNPIPPVTRQLQAFPDG
jgi:hypothetical protein